MKPVIEGKHVDIGDALREHVSDKIDELTQKYFNHATNASVTFSKEGHGHGSFKVHISILVGKNIVINTEAEAMDPYGSFDMAAEKAAKRLRRYKKKLRDHHDRTLKTPEAEIIKARDYILASYKDSEEALEQDNTNLPSNTDDLNEDVPQGDDPVIVAEMTTSIETMSVSEAVMRMDLSGQSALLFRNAAHDELNMVYKRSDGNVGWIDPSTKESSSNVA